MTGDDTLTVTDPSGAATKVSGRSDCQTHCLVSVVQQSRLLFLVACAHCETELSLCSIWLKKNIVRTGAHRNLEAPLQAVWNGTLLNKELSAALCIQNHCH